MGRAVAEQLPASCRRPQPAGHPLVVTQADRSSRPTGGALGGLDEETAFVENDVDCEADIILGYDWLRAHDLALLYDSDAVCLCAERGCTSGSRVRLDLTLDAAASPATRLSPAEACALLSTVGLGEVPTLGRPALWCPPWAAPHRRRCVSRGASAVWAEDTLAGLAETGTTLANGTELLVGRIAFTADGLAFALPVDDGDPPDFAALAGEYADVLADPPPGLPPDRGPAFQLRIFQLRIETGTHLMPRSRPMKRWSQGELDECRKQVAFLLDQGWIVPSCASHAASVVFARKADGTWRFCQDYRGLNAITQRSVEPLPHVEELVDETRSARFSTKLDLAMAYMQFRIREEDQYTRRRSGSPAASTSSASAPSACTVCRRC